MTRIVHILFAFVFTVLSIGIIINKHYSAGELFSISLFGEPESCCEMPCDCCDEESEVYKLSGDYMFSSNSFEVADTQVTNIIVRDAGNTSPAINIDEYRIKGLRKDIHPPRKMSNFLSEIQSYLL